MKFINIREVKQRAGAALAEAASQLRDAAVNGRKMPFESGRLRDATTYEIGGKKASIISDVPYARRRHAETPWLDVDKKAVVRAFRENF